MKGSPRRRRGLRENGPTRTAALRGAGQACTCRQLRARIAALEAQVSDYAMQARADAEQTAKQARAADERLREAFDLVPEAMALYDAEDRHVVWNRSYEE